MNSRVKNFLEVLKLGFFSLVIMFLLYCGIATGIFEFRHPKANRYAWMWHIPEVLTFQTVEDLR